LETMVERLRDDHENARTLAEGLARFPGIEIDSDRVQTNIVIFDMARKDLDAPGLVLKLAGHGVKCFAVGPNRIRMVTHKDVDRTGILYALEVLKTILQ
jgi:threonine aldolase